MERNLSEEIKGSMMERGYINLYKTGVLKERADWFRQHLESCDLCPRKCGVNRVHGKKGFCRTGRLPMVSSFGPHFGEEPPIVGTGGSGTIFFAHCTLRCVFCQNHQISQSKESQLGQEVTHEQLADMMIALQEQGCETINFVTPTHAIASIVESLIIAIEKGLHLPLVYNSSGYETLETIQQLDQIIDIYMPDMKYFRGDASKIYSNAPNYYEHAKEALIEMIRQKGSFETDSRGVATKGVILRHLVLPNRIADSRSIFTDLQKEGCQSIFVSLMAQYFPTNQVERYPEMNRTLTPEEYQEVVDCILQLDFEEGWMQDLDQAPQYYQPDFRKAKPFEE